MLCLAKNPEKQEKLRNEIRNILPLKDIPLSEESMTTIPYLRACIKEGLRIHPFANGNFRSTGKDLVLSGYQVPKGTEVSMISLSLFRNPDYYQNPDKFMPERWLREPQSKKNNPFVHLPFGFGARSCIGRRIVNMEMECAIARIIRNFRVEFNYSIETAFESGLFNVPAIPLTFKFTDINE